MSTRTRSLSALLGLLLAFTPAAHSAAQEPQPAPTPAPTEASQPDSATPAAIPATPAPAPASAGKKSKHEYTGPNTVIELPPTPMLDEEGNQRQDPDGKLLFNPPVHQQRDKYGHPLFTLDGKPVMQTRDNLGFDENGKKIHLPKEKAPKLVSVSISRGTLTVDGMTGKAALNYEIKDLQYIYFYVPGIGITVVSTAPFPGAVEQKSAFDDKSLTVNVGEHVLQLSSDKRMLGKNPESAFVRVDKNFTMPSKFPVMGYGTLRVAPYAWPGSKTNEELKSVVEAPALPADLRPELLQQPCPTGQMRAPAKSSAPGQPQTQRPCIPIAPTQTTASSATQTASALTNSGSK